MKMGTIVHWDDPGWRVLHKVKTISGRKVTMACGDVYWSNRLVEIEGTTTPTHERCLHPDPEFQLDLTESRQQQQADPGQVSSTMDLSQPARPNEHPPTPDQCSKKADLPALEGDVKFAVWHPQWGGYTGCCEVSFSRVTSSVGGESVSGPGCFFVQNWHNGEFVRPDEYVGLHYCAAEQLVNFGLDVLEKQMASQVDDQGRPVALDPEWVTTALDRLKTLLALSDERQQVVSDEHQTDLP